MTTVFTLLWFITLFVIYKLIKLKKEQNNKNRLEKIKSKLKNIFKSKENKIENFEFTSEQLNKFLVIAIIASVVSFFGIGITAPPVEETNEINNIISENIKNVIDDENNNVQEENQILENKNEILGENVENVISGENNSEEDNNISDESVSNEEKPVKYALESQQKIDVSKIPAYSEKPYVAINNNIPYFTDSDMTTVSYEYYSNLDDAKRCQVVVANIGKDIMPTEERGEIGSIQPTGWQTVKYDNISGKYLYNRCHLIGYQLSGENANEKNLITGTRYLNVEGMLPFENMVADYVEETNNHVLYRVTPIFEGDNKLASGVLMEAKSVEDNGKGIVFNVYCYNVQPGININYENGESSIKSTSTNTNTSFNNSVSKDNSANSNETTSNAGDSNKLPNTGSDVSSDESKSENTDESSNEVANIGNSTSSSDSSNSSSDKDSNTSTNINEEEDNSQTVYKTPTGKRYHFDPDCGGKNSTATTLDKAKSIGLTPCKKCAQ